MDEKIYWRQRGKNQWAKEGDRNTQFSHAKASKRKQTNTIEGIFDTGGQWKDMWRIWSELFWGTLETCSRRPNQTCD